MKAINVPSAEGRSVPTASQQAAREAIAMVIEANRVQGNRMLPCINPECSVCGGETK